MADNGSTRNSRSTPGLGWFIVTLLAVVAVQVVYGFAVFEYFGPGMAPRGQFGDAFGGVNALFTGLAFAGVIFTILLQRRELELQRDELRLTRDELHTSAEAQTEQVSQLKEAANLSALTALLNVYSTDLQPLREITKDYRRDLASLRAKQLAGGLSESLGMELDNDILALERRIVNQEAEWSILLGKHYDLVSRLETLVGVITNQGPQSLPSSGVEEKQSTKLKQGSAPE